MPLGAMRVSRKVMKVLDAGSGSFAHGHTFQAHSVACAAALEVQKIIREQKLLDNVKRLGDVLTEALETRFGAPRVSAASPPPSPSRARP